LGVQSLTIVVQFSRLLRPLWGRKKEPILVLDAEPTVRSKMEQAYLSSWRVSGASVTGVSHQQAGEPCDDAWFIGEVPNGFVIAVVSDGAGSARMGAFAAKTICDAFEELVPPLSKLNTDVSKECNGERVGDVERHLKLWEVILVQIEGCLTTVRSRLINHAATSGGQPDDYLATVLGVVAHPKFGSLCFHIGDGAITIFNKENEEVITSQPENGEYLNQTYFLIEEEWKLHFRVAEVQDDQLGSIFLMTDGVTDLAYHRHGRALTPELRFFTPLTNFLSGRSREGRDAAIANVLDAQRARELVNDDKTLVWLAPG
jgi:hypothetical protein